MTGPGRLTFCPACPAVESSTTGALTNQGIVNHLTTVTLATNGRVENNGLWQIVSPTTVNPGASATNTLFDNNSMLTVDLPSINNDALINVPFDSSGTIKVRNGELKLHLPNLDGGIVLVDSTATDPNAPDAGPDLFDRSRRNQRRLGSKHLILDGERRCAVSRRADHDFGHADDRRNGIAA